MKTIVLCLALLIPSMLSAAPLLKPSQESSAQKSPAKPVEIIELYSVYCGGCFYWEQNLIPELKTKLKEKNITFKQAHMPFMGKYSNEASTALAMTEGTPLYDKVKTELFKRIHVDRKGHWPSEAEFFTSLQQAGLSKKEYEQNKNGPVVLKSLADWKVFAQSAKAVPTFLLNGQYPIDTKGIKSVDDFMVRIETTLRKNKLPLPSSFTDGNKYSGSGSGLENISGSGENAK